MNNFSYFSVPITQLSDDRLISWLIAYMNGADLDDEANQREYNEFMQEVNNRDDNFKEKVNFLHTVL